MKSILTQLILSFMIISFASCESRKIEGINSNTNTKEISDYEKIAHYHGVFLDRIDKKFPRKILKSESETVVDTSSSETDWMKQKERFFEVLNFVLDQPEIQKIESTEKDKVLSFYKACFHYMEDSINAGISPSALLYNFLDSYLVKEIGVSITDLDKGVYQSNNLKSISKANEIQQVYNYVYSDSQRYWTNYYGNTRSLKKVGQYAADAAGAAAGILFGPIGGWVVGVAVGTMASEASAQWDPSEFAKISAQSPITFFM